MSVPIRVISQEHIKAVEELATIIWHHHYEPIIGKDQVIYMLNKFQSSDAIKKQIEEGYEYYLLSYEDTYAGYISIKRNTPEILFLSKIYVLSNFRGKKIGKSAMNFIMSRAKALGCKNIRLTVNKYNANSIAAYQRMGFKTIEKLFIDIGQGYIMDDYKMELSL